MSASEAGHEHFSLTNRGPLDRALARAGLGRNDPPRLLVRALAPALLVWLPLLLLTTLRPGDSAGAAVSFLEDLTTHVRFLLVVPLLVIIEVSIGRRTKLVAAHFVDANLISAADRPRYDALLRRAAGAVESGLAEAAVFALAIFFVWSAMHQLAADGFLFWFEEATPDGTRLSAAGWWYAFGSVIPPILFLRWIWRYAVWCWLLQRISRLDLRIVATHPDQASGLAFVSLGHSSFAQLGFAVSCLVASAVGNRILHEGASLASFQWPLAVIVALSIVVGIAPLAVFLRPLRIAKESGLLQYGTFSSRFIQDFHRKWIGTPAGRQPMAASDDIQSLADIGASFERVDNMRLLPVTLKSAIAFAVASLSPMLPLVLSVMPLKELLKLLMQAMI